MPAAFHIAVLAGARVVGVGEHVDGGLRASSDIAIDARRVRVDAVVSAVLTVAARGFRSADTSAFTTIASVVTCRQQRKVGRPIKSRDVLLLLNDKILGCLPASTCCGIELGNTFGMLMTSTVLRQTFEQDENLSDVAL